MDRIMAETETNCQVGLPVGVDFFFLFPSRWLAQVGSACCKYKYCTVTKMMCLYSYYEYSFMIVQYSVQYWDSYVLWESRQLEL